jgi:VanZ family protein
VLAGVFVLATGFGLGIEVLQRGIPYRTFDPADVAVNAAGAALAVTGWKLLVRRVRFYRLRRLERLGRSSE